MENLEVISVPKNYAILMVNIIGVCSKRGAFSPEEFKPVGELFDFLKKELKLDQVEESKQESKEESKQ
jgi:hypothetical protein